jgi:hypothetical protein
MVPASATMGSKASLRRMASSERHPWTIPARWSASSATAARRTKSSLRRAGQASVRSSFAVPIAQSSVKNASRELATSRTRRTPAGSSASERARLKAPANRSRSASVNSSRRTTNATRRSSAALARHVRESGPSLRGPRICTSRAIALSESCGPGTAPLFWRARAVTATAGLLESLLPLGSVVPIQLREAPWFRRHPIDARSKRAACASTNARSKRASPSSS